MDFNVKMKLSIIVPAHNEEKRIEKTLLDYASFFHKKYKKDFEIIVVLNGCKDNTLGIVKKIKKRYPEIHYLDFKQSGKGFAVISGFKAAKGNLMGFTDADDSTSAEEFDKLIRNIGENGGIIASRWIKGAVVKPKQPFLRIIAGRVFNLLIRFLFGIRIHDSQCGAKLFKKTVIKGIITRLGITEWAFDVDLLYQIKRSRFKIKEIPICWRDDEKSGLNIRKASFQMFFSILRLRLIYSKLNFIVKAYDLLPESIKLHHKLK